MQQILWIWPLGGVDGGCTWCTIHGAISCYHPFFFWIHVSECNFKSTSAVSLPNHYHQEVSGWECSCKSSPLQQVSPLVFHKTLLKSKLFLGMNTSNWDHLFTRNPVGSAHFAVAQRPFLGKHQTCCFLEAENSQTFSENMPWCCFWSTNQSLWALSQESWHNSQKKWW